MGRLLLACLIAITIFIHPIATNAKDTDLTPSQYKLSKHVASKFCEARNDGLSFESALGTSIAGAWWRALLNTEFLKYGFDVGQQDELTNEERNQSIEEYQKKYFADIGAFIVSKVQKDCPLNNHDFEKLKAEIDEIWLENETAQT